nr:hypothetical protein [uncultured Actinomyces sp.]
MQSFLLPRTAALTACLCIGAAPLIVAAPAHAADTPGPATCYVADENENILEPRREYVPNDGTGEVPVRPSPVVPGQYTLEISAPALNFDPDQPDVHFVCEVFYSPLGSVRLVDANGTVLAAQRYNNDQHNPSRAAATPLPALPAGYEIVPGQTVFGYDPVAGIVDPNNPANARAVGANTDIAIRKVSNNPAPTPSASTPTPTPSTPATPVPSTPATPTPTPSVTATPTPTPSVTSTPVPSAPATPVPTPSVTSTPVPSAPATPTKQTPAPKLARTGTVAGGFAGAAALLGLIGAGVIALRRRRD